MLYSRCGLSVVILVLIGSLGPLVQGDEEEKPAECIFPFTYVGREFTECTDLNGGRPWCATTKVYNGSWVYCAKKVGDLITNDHFLTILNQASEAEGKIKQILDSKNNKASSCSDCMEGFVEIQKWVDTQTRIYMDQNRRLQGLQKRVQSLVDLKAELKKYRQRRHCRQTATGADYLGRRTRSITGKTCQSWSSQSPHKHEMTNDGMFPDNRVSRAKNYCRNPNNSEKPWCFLDDTSGVKEYCNIPQCNVDCKDDENSISGLPLCDEYADMTCPSGYQYYKNTCYKIELNKKLSWKDAEQVCANDGGHLAIVDTYSENRYVASLLPKGKRAWIGGTDEGHEGRWTWSTGEPVKQSFWYTGEPNNFRLLRVGRSENCLILNWYSSTPWAWNDYDCAGREGYVCTIAASAGNVKSETVKEEKQEFKCPEEYKQIKDKCYRVDMTKKVNWNEAEALCNSKGGRLAKAETEEENNVMASVIPKGSKEIFWIGNSDAAVEDKWVWTDGSSVEKTFWHQGEPNNWQGDEDCGIINWFRKTPELWADYGCNREAFPLCMLQEGEAPQIAKEPFQCPSDFVQFKNRCFRAEVNQKVNWKTAEQICQKQGGRLAKAETEEENKMVASVFPKGSKEIFWIGNSDAAVEGKWVWTDGSSVEKTFWHKGEPNNWQGDEDCGIINWFKPTPELWADYGCDRIAIPICMLEEESGPSPMKAKDADDCDE